jgi:hypothetical protein
MANARRMRVLPAALLVSSLALAATARGAAQCEEDRGRTGLALAAAEEGLGVAAVDPDSAAAAAGVAGDDVVVQVNGVVLRGCADWARAVRDARRDRKALLLLVRRRSAEVPLVLGAATWDRAVAVVAAPAPEPPSVRRLVEAPPPPLPPDTTVTLEEVTRGLGDLASADRPSARVETYRADLLRVRRQIETLAARGSVPPDVLEGLRTVAGYYDAAGVAWESAETERVHEGRPRHVPGRDNATAPYFEDSDAAAVIDRFPFLRDTVVHEPARGVAGTESAGVWRPVQARALLWQRGHEELARLTSWLAASGR